MTKTIRILVIATAIVIGSIATGTIAFGEVDDDDSVLQSILCPVVGNAMTGIVFGGGDDDGGGIIDIFCAPDAVNDADSDPTNELQTLSDNGGVTLSDGGGTVLCASITGGAGLCDGVDAVADADSDSSNELQTLSGTGSVDLSDGGGSVSCASITGGAGLCDGVDAVGGTQQLVIEHKTLIYTDTISSTLSCTDPNGIIIAFDPRAFGAGLSFVRLGNGLNSVSTFADPEGEGVNLVLTIVCLSLETVP